MREKSGTAYPLKNKAFTIAACALLLASGWAGGALSSSGPAPQLATEVIGGQIWTYDLQVSNNAVDDNDAQVTADPSGSLDFLWRREDGGNGSLYYAKADRYGNLSQAETFITAVTALTAAVGDPQGAFAAIDSSDRIHVAAEFDANSVSYAQYESNGSERVAPKRVGPSDGQISETPAIAIGRDDTVHIAHGEYKFQCEDVAYDKLDNNGSDIWIDRVVSSDVASDAGPPIVRADPYGGSYLFTWGSSSGSWLGRFSRFGTKDMASVKFRNQTDDKPAEVTGSPNGSMHIVWEDSGNLYYTVVNSTGSKIVDARILEGNGTVGAFPRIASASDGTIIVVWEDNRAGSWQVRYGEVPPNGDLGGWSSYSLTQSTGDARDPSVTVDSEDQWVVAWTDTRDGDREIFVKRVLGCSMELYADPLDLDGGHFWHPNETHVIPMFLKNRGYLPDSFVIDLSFTVGAVALGWGVSTNVTYVDSLGPGEIANISLSIRAPANATQGDNISVSVNASSMTWPDCYDRIDVMAFVILSRALHLSANVSSVTADNGDTVVFPLTLTNRGDVPESAVNVTCGAPSIPNGWNCTLDQSLVSLDPHESVEINATLMVPTDTDTAPGGMSAIVGVLAQSTDDSAVYALKSLTVTVRQALAIDLRADPVSREARRGTTTTFTIDVRNVGNLAGQVKIDVEAMAMGGTGWQPVLDRQNLYLSGGESAIVVVSVPIPVSATPGATYGISFDALAVTWGLGAQVNLTVTIPALCSDSLSSVSLVQPTGGEPAVGTFNVTNVGDPALTYAIGVAALPAGWRFAAFYGPGLIDEITVYPPGTEQVTVKVWPDLHAWNGTYPLSVVLTSSTCGQMATAMPISIPPVRDLQFGADLSNASAPAGGSAPYLLFAENRGNVLRGVDLTLAGLPAGFAARWFTIAADGTNRTPYDQSESLDLLPYTRVHLALDLIVPPGAVTKEMDFTARAADEQNAVYSVALRFDLEVPDLIVESATFSPSVLVEGQATNVSVVIREDGGANASAGELRFIDNGTLISSHAFEEVPKNGTVTVTFEWTPSAGTHNLSFEVALENPTLEISASNNALVVSTTAAPATQPPGAQQPNATTPQTPSDGLLWPAIAAAVVIVAAALFAAFARARRRRGP